MLLVLLMLMVTVEDTSSVSEVDESLLEPEADAEEVEIELVVPPSGVVELSAVVAVDTDDSVDVDVLDEPARLVLYSVEVNSGVSELEK